MVEFRFCPLLLATFGKRCGHQILFYVICLNEIEFSHLMNWCLHHFFQLDRLDGKVLLLLHQAVMFGGSGRGETNAVFG